MLRIFRIVVVVVMLLAMLLAYVLWAPASMRPSASPAANASASRPPTIVNAQLPADTSAEKRYSNLATTSSSGTVEKIRALIQKGVPEVCGLSDFEAAYFLVTDGELDRAPAFAAVATATAKLLQGRTVKDRTLGLYVQAHQNQAAAVEEFLSQRCKQDFDCRIQFIDQLPEQTYSSVEPLVKLALAGRDPDIYAAAVYACRVMRNGECGPLGAAWAGIEPDNAAAWLAAASEAMNRNDNAAYDAAMRQVMRAREYNVRQPDLTLVFDSPALTSQSLLVRNMAGNYLSSQDMGAASSHDYALVQFCSKPEQLDATARATCERHASRMADNGRELSTVVLGTHLGNKLGWDATRLQALADLRTVAEDTMARTFQLDSPTSYSCDALGKNIGWMRQFMAKGEVAFVRDEMVKNGKDVTKLAGEIRAARAAAKKK